MPCIFHLYRKGYPTGSHSFGNTCSSLAPSKLARSLSLVRELPIFSNPIGFLRCCRLAAFVRANVPKKQFVCLVKSGTFARAGTSSCGVSRRNQSGDPPSCALVDDGSCGPAVKVVVHLSALDGAGSITARSDAVVSLAQIKLEDLGLQRFQGLFTDALCNGVYITPSRRASDYGRLGFVSFPLHTVQALLPSCP
jgi:hypothetical protein